ncbi:MULTISPECIES: SseB family protein [unclassified Rathayibacter]|uniref:SseB family protein n=1 Tax=unclassified Rathayibacter TaxID=2609250 RepID=UPI00188C350F|nr:MULTISPECIES: SseB family protein [unclassified Rathayibacter]MBF4461035.1 SseB family protein [Rathayibacter sp. VKM Ac-2879]MBF4502446.1 SseB family protein [Rathayibacter sp. VKM Ac-2878]
MARRGTPPARPLRPGPYRNTAAREALEALVAAPSVERIERLLAACLEGSLVVDVTGSQPGRAPHVRTVATTTGEPVLPLFTSTDELRAAVPRQQHPRVQMLVLPGPDAFALIDTADFVAVQLDAGSIAQVVTRRFVEEALARRSLLGGPPAAAGADAPPAP